MRRVLTILYLIFYVVIIMAATYDDLSLGYPVWFIVIDITCRVVAALCILLYILRLRPTVLAFLWKMVPIVLVMFDMFGWYYDFSNSVGPRVTPLGLTVLTILWAIILFPSWYLCFRFGYRRQIHGVSTTPPRKVLSTGIFKRVFFCLLLGLNCAVMAVTYARFRVFYNLGLFPDHLQQYLPPLTIDIIRHYESGPYDYYLYFYLFFINLPAATLITIIFDKVQKKQIAGLLFFVIKAIIVIANIVAATLSCLIFLALLSVERYDMPTTYPWLPFVLLFFFTFLFNFFSLIAKRRRSILIVACAVVVIIFVLSLKYHAITGCDDVEGKIFIGQERDERWQPGDRYFITPTGAKQKLEFKIEEEWIKCTTLAQDVPLMAYSNGTDVWLLDLSTGERKQVLSRSTEYPGSYCYLTMSPDGLFLVAVDSGTDVDDGRRKECLCLFDLHSLEQCSFSVPPHVFAWVGGGFEPHLTCSAGAEKVFFSNSYGIIYQWIPEKEKLEPFARGYFPEISADGTTLAYIPHDLRPLIYIDDLTGPGLKEIKVSGSWGGTHPFGIDLSPDGNFIAYRMMSPFWMGGVSTVGIMSRDGCSQSNIYRGQAETMQWVR